jgi:hypothetical protein
MSQSEDAALLGKAHSQQPCAPPASTESGRLPVLSDAIDYFRPELNRSLPLSERAENFWAVAVAVRKLGTAEELMGELTRFARDTGLVRDLGRHGISDVQHLVRSAISDSCPFARMRSNVA